MAPTRFSIQHPRAGINRAFSGCQCFQGLALAGTPKRKRLGLLLKRILQSRIHRLVQCRTSVRRPLKPVRTENTDSLFATPQLQQPSPPRDPQRSKHGCHLPSCTGDQRQLRDLQFVIFPIETPPLEGTNPSVKMLPLLGPSKLSP